MQKVIQRTATARKQAQKKLFRAQRREELVERSQGIRSRREFNKSIITNQKAARENRWEDWVKRDLAPKRDVGVLEYTYGTMDGAAMHPPPIPKHLRRKQILFAVADRVCIIRGRDAGKISDITQVNVESETVTLKDLNMADVAVPEWAKEGMGMKGDVMTQAMPVPMDNVRHVIALEDPDTQEVMDHIIEHAYAGKPYFERPSWSKLPRFTRYVSGLDIEIPWPKEEEPEIKDHDCDTSRYEVDIPSWTPTLESAPFPSSVLDELRNKYSRFRKRHDPEYVREKVIEEYRREWLDSQSLLTPLGQFRQQRAAKSAAAKASKLDANGNVIMDTETDAFISQFMNMNMGKSIKSKQKPKTEQIA
ncbi:hypothetical protein N7523_006967 [Penicillium sp. IBT 18751x]|nr:hypothetical protein N7523_006967 [Penicillium sp. IBT 18751x]